jgi:pimeloyl-ACP methyl ester carboxylesterase
MNGRAGRWTAIIVAILAATASNQSDASELTFQAMHVEVIGEGRPLLMVPGLNSSAEVWRETCKALQPDVQCHIIQLPGFAGQAPVQDAHWVDSMRDRLLAYVDHAKLQHPDMIGHSLGGVLGLELSIKAPDRFAHIVIVDSLPFLGGVRDPAATADSVRPMADGLRAGMLGADQASYLTQLKAGAAGLTNQPDRIATLVQWGETSDRPTTVEAMYELLTTDLRPQLAAIRTPTLVLGSWAAFANYGGTKAATQAIMDRQYANHPKVRIELSDSGYHFLMWDDPQWLQKQVRDFLKLPATVAATP